MLSRNELRTNILMLKYKKFHNLLNLLYIPFMIKFIFYPFLVVYHELQCIILDRHIEKSLFKISAMLMLLSASALLFNFYDLISKYSAQVLNNSSFSPSSIMMLSELTTLLILTHVSCYLGESIANFAFGFFYQDQEFYITNRKINQLKENLHKQGYTNFTNEEVLNLIEFCKKSLRKRSFTNFFGDKAMDWGNNLEAILYDADLEPFLDQQEALKIKLMKIKKTINILDNYSREKILNLSLSSLSSALFREIPTITIDSAEETEVRQIKNTCSIRSKNMLTNQTIINNSSTEKIVQSELNKIKIKYLDQNSEQWSTEDLIYHCQSDLKSKYLDIDMAIVPEYLITDLTSGEQSFNLFAPLYTHVNPFKHISNNLVKKFDTIDEKDPFESRRKSSSVTFANDYKLTPRLS
jgi:hypothetical protein